MRAAVVFYRDKKNPQELEQLAKGVLRGLQSQKGVTVDLISLEPGMETRLSGYGYLALGVPRGTLLKGKLPGNFKELLSSCGHLVGKKAFAFVPSKLIGSQKTLSNLMAAMEKEGIFLRFSEILTDAKHAEEVGAKLQVD
ncbi:MAG: hypothetical protein A2Z96_03140 [Spirochaetes bacterium GWB1_48_6]|nr:MAG: hypothetical protein A2Z96_03140 [Spirochaetes bacterium GWB1_48_6]